jgi:hypothetical protein
LTILMLISRIVYSGWKRKMPGMCGWFGKACRSALLSKHLMSFFFSLRSDDSDFVLGLKPVELTLLKRTTRVNWMMMRR